jgi:hypothetical protein
MKLRVATLLLSLGLLSNALLAGDSSTPGPESAPAIPAVPAKPAMTIHIDPATGQLVPVPAGELERLFTQDLRSRLSTSQKGLFETAAPGGGTMIHLQDRFQNAMSATIDAQGGLVAHCDAVGTAPSPDDPAQPAPKPEKE